VSVAAGDRVSPALTRRSRGGSLRLLARPLLFTIDESEIAEITAGLTIRGGCVPRRPATFDLDAGR
jgi:hypothetical protein